MKITIECEQQHLNVLKSALDMFTRVGIGQFDDIANEHVERISKEQGRLYWDIREDVEKAVKGILMPGYGPGSSFGIGNEKVTTDSKIAYELWKLFGGGNGYPPLNFSGVPLPKVQIEGEL